MSDFQHDAMMLRTTGPNGEAHGGFIWPREVEAVVTPTFWNSEATCGAGLHGLLDGLGDNSLMSREAAALWWVVGIRRDEAVRIDDAKVKVPRAKVLYFGHMPGAYQMINSSLITAIKNSTNAATSGDGANAATSGDGANAATSGDGANAATSGTRANAATSGDGANAATSGKRANAATSGTWANAATSGDGANAATSGKRANAATSGTWANAATSGDGANAATSGKRANAATSGTWANAATSGDGANAATSGDGANAATSGKDSVAAALGANSAAKAGAGGAIMLVNRDENGGLISVKAVLVGQEGIKPNIYYKLTSTGHIVPAGI